MRTPKITSFNNGVIEWSTADGECRFVLSVDGENIGDDDGFFRAKKFDASALSHGARLELTAVYPDGKAAVTVVYNAKKRVLELPRVTEFAVDGETLKWEKTAGARAYKVYDTDYNATTVHAAEYDMSVKNPILCVCPVPESKAVCAPEAEISDIPYLSGGGTADDPYIIKTPFDLRTVDYYESLFAERGGSPNTYVLGDDIDYGTVHALDNDSNIFSLKKPFFGVLDGKNKKLSDFRVEHDGGHWAMFEHIARGGVVKNLTVENADITCRARDAVHPINSSVAAIAYFNDGEISSVKLRSVRLTAVGGGPAGIAVHNHGRVIGCSMAGVLVQGNTSALGSASYEAAGIVLENCAGGEVDNNYVFALNVRGSGENVRSAAGVVSVNREGGKVLCNGFDSVVMTNVAQGSEYGGVAAYNAGVVRNCGAKLGTLVVGGVQISGDENFRGKLVGKNDGEASMEMRSDGTDGQSEYREFDL